MARQQPTEAEFHEASAHLDALMQELEDLPFPAVREMVFDLLQAVDIIHRAALTRMLDILDVGGQNDQMDRLTADPIVRTLLAVYDLAPGDSEVPAAAPPPRLIQIEPSHTRTFEEVCRVEDLPPDSLQAFDVAGVRVLVANVEGQIYAVRASCPGSAAPLELGSYSAPILVCPWHNDAFDIRTGKRVDGERGQPLSRVPVTIANGMIKLAVRSVASAATRSSS